MEPQYNEQPRDWENVFIITGVRSEFFTINFTITGPNSIVRYTGYSLYRRSLYRGFHCNRTDKLSATGKGIP